MPGRQRRDQAVAVGHRHAEPDQREHVEAAVDERARPRGRRTASRPTARPGWPGRARPSVRVRAASSSPAPNIGAIAITSSGAVSSAEIHSRRVMSRSSWSSGCGAGARLERHAAHRAVARGVLDDLGVHRAHPLGPGDRGLERHAAHRARPGPVLLDLRDPSGRRTCRRRARGRGRVAVAGGSPCSCPAMSAVATRGPWPWRSPCRRPVRHCRRWRRSCVVAVVGVRARGAVALLRPSPGTSPGPRRTCALHPPQQNA